MRKGRLKVLRAAAHAMAITALLACSACASGGPRTDGPAERANATDYYPTFKVGTVFTDGLTTFAVQGNQGARIDDVQVLGATSGIKVLGVMVAGPRRKWAANESFSGYPPSAHGLGPISPAVGYEVKPGIFGVELLIGMKITEPGIQRRTGIRVIYTVGSRKYQYDYHAGVVNCPKSVPFRSCRVPAA